MWVHARSKRNTMGTNVGKTRCAVSTIRLRNQNKNRPVVLLGFFEANDVLVEEKEQKIKGGISYSEYIVFSAISCRF